MIAADLMSRSVVSVGPDAPLVQAVRAMTERRISGLPVVDAKGRLVGMLTEGDLLRRVETATDDAAPGWFERFVAAGRLAEDYVRSHGRRVAEVMTPEVVSVEETTALAEVVRLMRQHRVRRLPVLRDGALVGIISRAGLVRRIDAALGGPAVTADDASIRGAILDGLARAPWSSRNPITVTVEHGTVRLDGCLFDLRERDAIGVLAENVPGVTRVENRLACVEPISGVLLCDPGETRAAD